MAELIMMGSFITASERHAAEVLRGLPEKWLVICNKELVSPSATTYEVDFIVVGDHTIFVIDEKSWRGAIYGNENVWILSGSEPRPNPLQKISHVARQLASVLRGRIPFLHNLPPSAHFVHPVVLMSDPGVEYRIQDARVGNQVVRLADALDELTRLDKALDKVTLEPARDKLRVELTGLKNRPQFPRSINSYTVKEVLPGGPRYRAFLTEHRGGAKRLLKLYDLDRDLQPRTFLEREYYAVLNASRQRVSPSVDPFFFWGDDQYMAIPFHLPEGHAFRNPAPTDQLHSPRYSLTLTISAFEALKVLHGCGIVHRWITPDRIFGRAGSSAQAVEFFDFAFCHIDQQQSIAAELDALQLEDVFLAPECKVSFSFATKASDVYGLALSLAVHLAGQEPSAEELSGSSLSKWIDGSMRSVAAHWPAAVLKSMISFLQRCTQEDERKRPTPEEIVEGVRALLGQWDGSNEAQRPDNPQTLGQGQYRVVRQLGSGATAFTYLVEDTFIGGMYVLKRIRNQALAQRLAGAEFRALRDLNHPNLPHVYDVRPGDQDFQLKLEYIPGCTLDTAWDQYQEQIGQWLLLARSLLGALAYLEDHGILHRDLSPRNIIVPDEDQGRTCLIDFGMARLREEQTQSAVGTPLYRAPEAARGAWNASSDVYSAGVILFRALTGALPFPIVDEEPQKEIEAPLSLDLEARLGKRVIQVLRKAVGPADFRYGSAQAFLDDIEVTLSTPEVAAVADGAEIRLEWVREVRGLYRNSATGNGNNRGLETPFVRGIYVPTLLDTALLPEVLSGRKRLVFLTGNPGDGKTAFLGKLRDRLEMLGGTPHEESRYGWEWTLNGIRFKAIYDASESQDDGRKHADQVLQDALEPFQGQAQPDLAACPVVLIAINDGRLHEFCELQRVRFTWLADQIEAVLFGNGDVADQVALIDLKRRALAQLPNHPNSLFRSMLSTLVHESKWQDCDLCIARTDCPIKFNADSLRQPNTARRLEHLFLIQHWRRNRRATIRDVRSALAFVITDNLCCDDVHSERLRPSSGSRLRCLPFYDTVFNATNENDELLRELAGLDPAWRTHPRLERFLHFHRPSERFPQIEHYLHAVPGRSPNPGTARPETWGDRWIAAMKRRIYFEADDQKLLGDRWALPATAQLLPYWYLDDFAQAVSGQWSEQQLRQRLLSGISQSEGVPYEASQGRLSLTLSKNSQEELTVIKQFEPGQFCCSSDQESSPYIEAVPDTLELTHVEGSPTLRVTLDMFELLSRLADGYTATSQEFEPFLIELEEFKAMLLRKPVKEALLLEGRSRLHRVTMHDGRVEIGTAL